MGRVLGITISKNKLVLNDLHAEILKSQNIGVLETDDRYILHYKPDPFPSNKETVCHLKGILMRIRSEDIYSSYNDDFGEHDSARTTRTRPLIKIKLNT